MSDVVEMKRGMEAKGVTFFVNGCTVSIQPPEDRSLTINELAEVFDEAKRMVIYGASLSLWGKP